MMSLMTIFLHNSIEILIFLHEQALQILELLRALPLCMLKKLLVFLVHDLVRLAVLIFLWINKQNVNLLVLVRASNNVLPLVRMVNLLVKQFMKIKSLPVMLFLQEKKLDVYPLLLHLKHLVYSMSILMKRFVSLIVPALWFHDLLVNDGKQPLICSVSGFVRCLSSNNLSKIEQKCLVSKPFFRRSSMYWRDSKIAVRWLNFPRPKNSLMEISN